MLESNSGEVTRKTTTGARGERSNSASSKGGLVSQKNRRHTMNTKKLDKQQTFAKETHNEELDKRREEERQKKI